MHPEVKKDILKKARIYFLASIEDHDSYTLAAENGYITFDDVYLNALYPTVYEQAESDLINIGVLTQQDLEYHLEDGIRTNPQIHKRTLHLLSQITNSSPLELEARLKKIDNAVIRFTRTFRS